MSRPRGDWLRLVMWTLVLSVLALVVRVETQIASRSAPESPAAAECRS